MFELLRAGQDAEGAAAFERLIEVVSDPVERLDDTALYYFLRYRFLADGSAIDRLQELLAHEEVRSRIYSYLGSCYEVSGLYDKAVEAFRLSMENSTTPEAKVQAAIRMSSSTYATGKIQEAHEILQDQLQTVTDMPALEAAIYEAAASLYEKSNDRKKQALALERIIEQRPTDLSLRFKLAHSYAEAEMHDLAALHYRTYLRFSPEEPAALNNIGVAYDRLKFPISAVNSYEDASKRGNTLAMANLAWLQINAGFLANANEILKRAQATESSVHPNVNDAMARFPQRQEQEEDGKEQLFRKTTQRQTFLKSYAEALFRSRKSSLPAKWTVEELPVTIKIDEEGWFWAEWTKGQTAYIISGFMQNSAAEITARSRKAPPSSNAFPSLASLASKKDADGYLYIDRNGEIRVMAIGDIDEFKTISPVS